MPTPRPAGRLPLLALVPLLATHAATALPAVPAPKLVVAVSVDQFSADLYAEYRPLWRAGLRRLGEGAVFPSGYQSHALTETCPGHSTILTGSHPARTGIIANEWIDASVARAEKRVYCAEDPAIPGEGGGYTPSPQYLRVPTLGDRLKAADPASRVVAVAGKDRAALMMGGHGIDEPWFWSGKAFVTLAERARRPAPATVAAVNGAVSRALAEAFVPPVPEACRARALATPVGARSVGVEPTRAAGDLRGFRTSPEFDRAITDLAIGLVHELGLGKGAATDVISVGLSATDYVGHTFGVEGAEMCTQLLGVDANVGRLLDALDAEGVPYVLVLTADHGGHDLPERNRSRGIDDAVRVDAALEPELVGRRVAAELKLPGSVLRGVEPYGDVYLSPAVPTPLRARALNLARRIYASHPQVAAVFTAAEVAAVRPPATPPDEWTLIERVRASFDPARSGDLIVELKPHVTPIADVASGYVATHGSPWNYDRRVPILFYQAGRPGFEQPLPVETVDILPTLAALISLHVPPHEIDGRCLNLGRDGVSTCPAAP